MQDMRDLFDGKIGSSASGKSDTKFQAVASSTDQPA
jgi:hypothetical protein